MNAETIKNPWQVEVGDIILRHPDHPETLGEWRATGEPRMAHGLTSIPYEMPDGGEGVFVLEPVQTVAVRPATTYRVHALLTTTEREVILRAMVADARDADRELVFILAQVIHRYPEIFDDAYSRLQVARTADADVLKETA